MSKYSVIVFDLGNVLLPFDYTKVIDFANTLKKDLGNNFAKLYRENYHIHREYESGKITTDDFVNTMLDWLEFKVTGEEFCKIFSNIFTHNWEVIDLLPKLKKNYTLCLLSNTNEIHEKYGYGHEKFLKTFDKLFLSYKVGAIKPEEKIYRAVEDYTKKPSAEHLFIDDIPEYVNGAKTCGWDAVQFTGYNDLIEELKTRKIEF